MPRVTLQWVHGPRTVVIHAMALANVELHRRLQWVHGPRTVVIAAAERTSPGGGLGFNGSTVREPWLLNRASFVRHRLSGFNGSTVREPWLFSGERRAGAERLSASMGPRSENRGYFYHSAGMGANWKGFNGSTVREPWLFRETGNRPPEPSGFNGSTVREPWLLSCWPQKNGRRLSFNGSTVREPWLFVSNSTADSGYLRLQWVHGPRTVVISCAARLRSTRTRASMGPRSENRGYSCSAHSPSTEPRPCFNGSTVREPWLLDEHDTTPGFLAKLQWVHGPRTVVISAHIKGKHSACLASMGPRSENRGYLTEADS